MESITEQTAGSTHERIESVSIQDWGSLLELLPAQWKEKALEYKALQRHRGIRSVEDLLHLGLAYSVLDKSLTELGSWAASQEMAEISAPGLYARLCAAREWLGWLLVQFMEERRLRLPQGRAVNVEIRDATVISRPGSQGTDWRVHLDFNLGRMGMDGVALTDAKGGESLLRFASSADRIVLADRIHAHRKGLDSLLEYDASFVIRLTWSNLPLEDARGQPWQMTDWLQYAFTDLQANCQEQTAYLPGNHGPLRVCAVRLSQEKAELAVKRARQQAKKNGHTPDQRTLLIAQFMVVVTNLPVQAWDTQQVLELYRVRWQVELFFKRLKSILFLDHLRARKTKLAQTYLLGKLLAACLLDSLSHRFVQLLPEGFSTLNRPLSYWTLFRLLWEQFQCLIRGPLLLERYFASPQKYQRFLCSPPRKRKQQLAWLQARLVTVAGLSPSSCPLPYALS